MGTFVKLFRDSESIIPESRKEEFIERIEKIYQAGGMMEVEDVVLYRQRLTLIRKPKMDDDGMNFYYNYFEDDCWKMRDLTEITVMYGVIKLDGSIIYLMRSSILKIMIPGSYLKRCMIKIKKD